MRAIAKNRGGKCLSEDYINNHTKLKWQCAEGHTWLATPRDVVRKTWCPQCANKRKGRIKKHNRNYKKFPHEHNF
jgi:hypothetical protein